MIKQDQDRSAVGIKEPLLPQYLGINFSLETELAFNIGLKSYLQVTTEPVRCKKGFSF